MVYPTHITRYDKDRLFKYQIVTSVRGNSILSWKDVLLVEYSLPDSNGDFMRVRTVARFGPASNDESWKDARFLMTALIQCHNLVS